MTLWIERAGRWLLALLFVAGTIQKVTNPDAAIALLEMRGWPQWLIWPAAVLNAAGAFCLIAGLLLGPVGLTLALYCIVTSYFHFLPDDPWQMSIVVNNWAIAGGLMVVAAHHGMGRPQR